jgi:N-acylneuraminate cytidylyltransferase
MKLLALIPARGGSKGIPRKNIKPLAGKPLLGWTIDVARQAGSIDRIIVSTEDEEIASIARDLGAEVPFMRPAALSADDTPGIEPVIHALEQLPEVDWLLLLQPTSPLRAVADIEGIVQLCFERDAPSAVSVTVVDKHPYWMYHCGEQDRLDPVIPDQPANTRRRQDLPPAYTLNGALYLARRDWLLEHRRFVGPDTLGYVMPPERSVDLDTPRDWDWVEFLIEREHVK